ncbi:UBX domain-containing protein 7 isoform X2 [Anabrus simplex]|uniref:UBX domain-containing protein 7 isoform X2 n=1 Tax=Anabrus simplex TaxID=316456 RepID=UPI0034DCFD4D
MSVGKTNTANMSIPEDLVGQFCTITGAAKDTGLALLRMCSGNLESALNLYLDSGGGKPFPENPNDKASTSREDTDPGVRAPIPQSQGVLVDGQFDWLDVSPRRGIPSVFDPFRSFDTRNNEAFTSQKSAHLKTLEDLFRPPLDITFKGTFAQVREAGVARKRWILVDIQNVTEFQCQCLNRDIWSNKVVREIIDKHFLLWQVYLESGEGRRFITFYKVTVYPYVAVIDPRTGENMRVWNSFSRSTFASKLKEFLTEQENNSLSSADAETDKADDEAQDSPSGSKRSMKTKTDDETQDSPSGSKRPMKTKLSSIVDANEEEQFKAALAASIVDVKSRFENGVGPIHLNGLSGGCSSKSESKNGTKKKVPVNEPIIPPFATSLSNGQVPPHCSSDDSEFDYSWREFLGDNEDPLFNLIIRYPDASREELTIPSTSQVQAVTRYVTAKGYSEDEYDLLTFYPKRFFSRIAKHLTLLDIGFTAQETVFVHPK